MRIETLGPRTWLLGAVAVWSLLLWVLALAGLGGKVAPLAEDPALATALPQWRASTAPALGGPDQYATIGVRPLFDENRRPRPFFIEGGEAGGNAAQTFDYVLTSVLITPTLRMAIIEPSAGGESLRVREGANVEAASGWRLVELAPRSATFEGPGGRQVMELRAFAGTAAAVPPAAGQAAVSVGTPVAVPPAAAAPAQAAKPAPVPPPRAAEPAQPTQQQLDAIRQRIEARRKQLRERSAAQPPSNP